jgi:uncharacterized membrane protein
LDSGDDVSRILALSDGVFAFAMTLLVINLVVPTSGALVVAAPNANPNVQLGQYLLNNRISFLAYGLAFYIIGTWWIVHHRIFRWIERYNRTLMGFNLFFLLFIAVTPFDVGLLANYSNTTVAVSFYAGAQALAGLVLLLMLVYLRGPGRRLMAPTTTDAMLYHGTLLSGVTPTGFALSIPLAVLSPQAAIASWLTIFLARGIIMRRFPDPTDATDGDRALPERAGHPPA